jgi:hypothetical protein
LNLKKYKKKKTKIIDMDTNCKKCWKHPSVLGTPLPKCNNKEITECCITKTKKKCCSGNNDNNNNDNNNDNNNNNDQENISEILGGGLNSNSKGFNKEIYKDENY